MFGVERSTVARTGLSFYMPFMHLQPVLLLLLGGVLSRVHFVPCTAVCCADAKPGVRPTATTVPLFVFYQEELASDSATPFSHPSSCAC